MTVVLWLLLVWPGGNNGPATVIATFPPGQESACMLSAAAIERQSSGSARSGKPGYSLAAICAPKYEQKE